MSSGDPNQIATLRLAGAEASRLLRDPEHDLAECVSARDLPQRLANLLQRHDRFNLWAQLARVDQPGQCLQPRPVDVGGARFARDAPLERRARALILPARYRCREITAPGPWPPKLPRDQKGAGW